MEKRAAVALLTAHLYPAPCVRGRPWGDATGEAVQQIAQGQVEPSAEAIEEFRKNFAAALGGMLAQAETEKRIQDMTQIVHANMRGAFRRLIGNTVLAQRFTSTNAIHCDGGVEFQSDVSIYTGNRADGRLVHRILCETERVRLDLRGPLFAARAGLRSERLDPPLTPENLEKQFGRSPQANLASFHHVCVATYRVRMPNGLLQNVPTNGELPGPGPPNNIQNRYPIAKTQKASISDLQKEGTL